MDRVGTFKWSVVRGQLSVVSCLGSVLTDDYNGILTTDHGPSFHFAAVLRGDVNVISTRRFFVRPATVVFGATGFDAPIPLA